MLGYTDILEKYWGYTSFRPLQLEIIEAAATHNEDVIVLLPTGGGKSVCFQVPALAKPGICVVISPLIALMNDQVANLQSKGIKAVSLGGNLNFRELDRLLDLCVYGDVKFLYLSPERLQSELVQERLKRMKVNLLAIDEAHCISQWGYDFRPSYLQIKEIRSLLPGVPCMALTASATNRVIDDIAANLEFKKPKIFKQSFYRPNLSLFVQHTEQKADYLFKVLKKNPGSGLVYVQSRKDTKVLAELIKGHGYQADFYHAGLTAVERQARQQSWLQGKTRVMVCTNAFGMGIDKADVRFVIHWGMTSSLEAYYQEAGRTGRDGQKSFAVALVNQSDIDRLGQLVEESFPEKDVVKRVYSLLGSHFQLAYGSGMMVFKDFDVAAFSSFCKLPPKTVHHCLEILKHNGFILLNEAYWQPARVNVLMNQTKLYEFQVFNPKFEPLLKLLMRSYAGLFDDFVPIDEWMLAKKLNCTVELLRKNLNHLQQLNVIDYAWPTEKPQLAFATERLREDNFHLSPVAYENRKAVMQNQVDGILGFLASTDACRFELICRYFDEQETEACGHCDNCLNKSRGNQLSSEEIADEINKLLQERPHTAQELKAVKKLRFHDAQVDEVLQWMLGQESLKVNKEGKFILIS